jgi:hypothetical protein
VVVALSGNATIRMLTGFLMMFAAFAVRAQTEWHAFQQLLLGVIAGAVGLLTNGIGARMHIPHPEQVMVGRLVSTAAIVGLVGPLRRVAGRNALVGGTERRGLARSWARPASVGEEDRLGKDGRDPIASA